MTTSEPYGPSMSMLTCAHAARLGLPGLVASFRSGRQIDAFRSIERGRRLRGGVQRATYDLPLSCP